MTTAKPATRYGATEGARAVGSATGELHHPWDTTEPGRPVLDHMLAPGLHTVFWRTAPARGSNGLTSDIPLISA